MAIPPSGTAPLRETTPPAADTPLLAEDLTFGYGGAPVLAGVSCALRSGEVLGVVGPNGSGKTTLLRCLLGYVRPTIGRVILDGREVSTLDRRSFARRVAAVPQEAPTELPMTVENLVLLGRLPHSRGWGLRFDSAEDLQVAKRALASCGIAELATRPVHQLSGGEKRRALIARALAQEAAVLLLDEPTSGLDLQHQLAVLALVREQARAGAAVLTVLHDLNLAAGFCDRVLVLDRGGAVAEGTPAQVLIPAVLEPVFRVRLQLAQSAGGGGRQILVALPAGSSAAGADAPATDPLTPVAAGPPHTAS